MDVARPSRVASVFFNLFLGAALAAAPAGCGSSGGGTGSCATSPSLDASAPLHGQCSLATHVGQFTLALNEADAYSEFGGAVYDAVNPSSLWVTQMTVGSCRVQTGLSNCSPVCAASQICGLDGQCHAMRTSQSVGDVTLSGVGCPRTESYKGAATGYLEDIHTPYPPAAAGAPLAISAAGGAYSAFTLHAEGVEPLVFDGSSLSLISGQDLTVTWTQPAQVGEGQIQIVIDAAHHGGTAAQLECDGVADTGSITIDGSLIAYLISKGTAGFPQITVARLTADSTTIAPGCVDFTVLSSVTSPIAVCTSAGSCVVSCNSNADCTAPATCQTDLTCK